MTVLALWGLRDTWSEPSYWYRLGSAFSAAHTCLQQRGCGDADVSMPRAAACTPRRLSCKAWLPLHHTVEKVPQ